MRIGYKLVRLANGLHSVHALAEKETFHPVIGPVAEAEALYLRQLRLADRMRQTRGQFVLWDIGLGAAANVLTVLRSTGQVPNDLHVVSFDRTNAALAFALGHTAELGYLAGYERTVSTLIQDGTVRFRNDQQRVTWETHLADFPALVNQPSASLLPKPHAIMFDAFSPARNPEMWTQDLFARLRSLLPPALPCAMANYTRSTLVRVTWLLAGFYVGAGHATGEKEETSVAATTLELVETPLDRRWLLRARRSTSAEPLHEPVYRQAPMSAATWEKLLQHDQFTGCPW